MNVSAFVCAAFCSAQMTEDDLSLPTIFLTPLNFLRSKKVQENQRFSGPENL